MWGTRFDRPEVHPCSRFIPTHVGNTPPGLGRRGASPVHPHACGEHLRRHALKRFDLGSSPRMWGTRKLPSLLLPRTRFIPTHVGNTCFPILGGSHLPVHPHACGEHGGDGGDRRAGLGSSPRMWGTRELDEWNLPPPRFIPTHVGNTETHLRRPPAHAVHPHACGEHYSITQAIFEECGSSPRMWGTLRSHHCNRHLPRFIPTHVGNTQPRRPYPSVVTVHPHACGEHIQPRYQNGSSLGSSPRMWGTPLRRL